MTRERTVYCRLEGDDNIVGYDSRKGGGIYDDGWDNKKIEATITITTTIKKEVYHIYLKKSDETTAMERRKKL